MSDDFIHAPFSSEQVDALNKFQRLGYVHEFTCPNHHGDADRALFATVGGWRCPHCDYSQDWAHPAMLHTEPLEGLYKLPCDVMLPPATLVRKGCGLDALMEAFKARASLPPEECRFDDPADKRAFIQTPGEVQISVNASDYQYEGRLAGIAVKASGAVRYVIEDANRRLFIHNHHQIQKPEGWLP